MAKKSVYHIHLTAPTHPNGGWEQGFIQNGYSYFSIEWQEWSNTWGQVPCKNKILGEVKTIQPDFVFMQLQGKSFFDNAFVVELRKTCPVILFNEDVRNDYQWMIDIAADITFISNMDDAVVLMENRLGAAHMLPTYDERYYYQIPVNQKRYDKFGEIVFIGNQYAKSKSLNFPNAPQRLEMVEFLQMQFGNRFQTYGMGTQNSYLKPADEAEAYRNARIVIGHNNFHRTDYQSDRMIRACASGALFVPHFNNVSSVENMWTINGSWSTFAQLGMIVEEYLTNASVANAMRGVQREGVAHHSPMYKILELERKMKELL